MACLDNPATGPDRILQMMNARSLVFVGGEGITSALSYTRELGFAGRLAVVNAKRASVAGIAAVPRIEDLDFIPDLAFVAVNRHASIKVVRDLASVGVPAIVCNASGFAEVGPEGASLQDDLVFAAGNSILIGPNCNGFVNYLDGVAAMVGHMGIRSVQTGAALVSQGGGFLVDIALSRRSLPIAYIIGTGNQAMINAAECVSALVEDERVKAIGLYLEGNLDVEKMSLAAARALERGTPIVALKSGRSAAGARAVRSHTASLAGENELVDALFRRFGFIQAASIAEVIETLKFLTIAGVPRGPRVGIISSSGVESALAADAADAAGLIIPPIDQARSTELRAVLPEIATPNNPLDMTTTYWGDRDKQAMISELFLRGGFDLAVGVASFPPEGTRQRKDWDTSVDSFVDAAERTKTMAAVVSSLAENLPHDVRERLAIRGVAPLQGTRDGMRAIGHAARYGAQRDIVLKDGPQSVLLPAVRRPHRGALRRFDEHSAKLMLADAGVQIPVGAVVTSGDLTMDLPFSGPYAVKLLSAKLLHKSDVGAVRLGVSSLAAVRSAMVEIGQSIAQGDPGLNCDRFLVEEMITDGLMELLLGIRRDPQVGLALVIGSGGSHVELFRDAEVLLLPTSRAAIHQALLRLRIAPIFQGFRGRPNADLDAVTETIVRFGLFAQTHGEHLAECEINPLIVRPSGWGAVAADAVLVMYDEESAATEGGVEESHGSLVAAG